jgi:hypothetical protein
MRSRRAPFVGREVGDGAETIPGRCGASAELTLCHPEERSDEGSLSESHCGIKGIPRFARDDNVLSYRSARVSSSWKWWTPFSRKTE